MKRLVKMNFHILILVGLMLALSSCALTGSSALLEVSLSETDNSESNDIIVLTVSYLNEAAMDEKIASFETIYPNIKVVATNHINDFQRYYEQLQKKLMVKDADDMFEVTGLPYYEYAEKGLLVNIYDLIWNDSSFDENSYFMNVLQAMEYKGGLYAFPKSFDIEFITVNQNAPAGLLDEFYELEYIDYRSLVDLHYSYGLENEMYVEPEFTLKSKVYQSLPELVNFENRTCDFNNANFIQLLKDYKTIVKQGNETSISLTGGEKYEETDAELIQNYLYRKARYDEFQYFIGYNNIPYKHAIPLTTSAGEIIIDPYNAYSVYQGSNNKDAAWNFAKFLTSRAIASRYSNSCFPLNKSAFERLYWGIRDKAQALEILDVSGQYKLDGIIYTHIDKAFEMLTRTVELPARVRFPYFEGSELVFNEIDLYLQNLISAEQTAQNIQNKMFIKLAE